MKGRIVWSVRTQGLREKKKRKLTERYKYARKGPVLALDLYIRTIAIESERSGWPLEVIASVVSTHSLRVKTGNKQSQIDDHKRRGFSTVDDGSSAFVISPPTVLRVYLWIK